MKRSRRIHLALMASGAVALSACDDTPAEPQVPVTLYHSVEQCVAEGKIPEADCKQYLEEALAEHKQAAPRFSTQALCEQEFAQTGCQMQSGPSGGFWMPFFMGYVVSEVIDEVGDALSGRNRRRDGRYASPVYYSGGTGANRTYRTPTGAAINSSNRGLTLSKPALTAPPAPAKIQTRTTVVSRSGFGGFTSSFGG